MHKYANVSIHIPTIIHLSYTSPYQAFWKGEIQKADCTNIVISYTMMCMVSFSLDLQQSAALVSSVDVIFVTLMYTDSLLQGPQSTVHHTVGKELILDLCTYETLIFYQY